MNKTWGAALGTLMLAVLLLAALLSGRAEERAEDAPARFDEATGRCVGGGETGSLECEEQLAQVESTLKNAATAQESYATVSNGEYTEDISDLEQEGLQVPPTVQLTIVTGRDQQYCMEATSQELGGTMHYSSTEGLPRPGPCS